jgi:hypothetical protein
MTKGVILLSLVLLMSACAGMDYQYQQNMAVNATGYGLAGGAAGAAIASLTHGNVGAGAAIGALSGAILGAANTPPPGYYDYPPPVDYSPPACGYRDRGGYCYHR